MNYYEDPTNFSPFVFNRTRHTIEPKAKSKEEQKRIDIKRYEKLAEEANTKEKRDFWLKCAENTRNMDERKEPRKVTGYHKKARRLIDSLKNQGWSMRQIAEETRFSTRSVRSVWKGNPQIEQRSSQAIIYELKEYANES